MIAEKRDANYILCNEGSDALRTEHDGAEPFSPDPGQQPKSGPNENRESGAAKDDRRYKRSDIEFADDAMLPLANDYVVKWMIPNKSVAILYGATTAGKTFLAILLAFCIAIGKPFFGRKTRKGAVLYVALEGQGGFGTRVVAARSEYGNPGKLFARLKTPIFLGRSKAAETGVTSVVEAANYLEKEAGCPVALIIIDTYARALAGDDENEAATFAAVTEQLDRIVSQTGAAILLIHHPGKNAGKGPRGSSAIIPAADASIVIERDGKVPSRSVTLEKVRDGVEGPLGEFTLKTVTFGKDEDGDEISSCTVEATQNIGAKGPRRPKPETQAGKALNELEHLLTDRKDRQSRGHDRIPDGVGLIKLSEWAAACKRKRISSSGKPKSEDRAFQRATKTLVASSLVGEFGDDVWLIRRHQATSSFAPGNTQ